MDISGGGMMGRLYRGKDAEVVELHRQEKKMEVKEEVFGCGERTCTLQCGCSDQGR